MLRVAGLGPDARRPAGALIELRGCRALLGCPRGTAEGLAALGIGAADVHAVLLTCGRSLEGWLELRAALPGSGGTSPRRPPRLLGTAPVLLAAGARLADLLGAGALGAATTAAEVAGALSSAEEVSYGQEVSIEGPLGPVTATAASSGFCLGGATWVLEALGARVAALGAASAWAPLSPRPLDAEALRGADAVVACLGPEGDAEAEGGTAAALAALAAEAAAAVRAGGSVLVPLGGGGALAPELAEALGQALAALPAELQAPVLAVGGPARLLRRCGTFAEWAHPRRLAYAYSGKSPFSLEAMEQAGRLALADAAPELGDAYREPCVVMAPLVRGARAGPAAHFAGLWAGCAAARVLCADPDAAGAFAAPPGAGRPALLALGPRALARLLGPDPAAVALAPADLAGLPAGAAGAAVGLVRAEFREVPLDLRRPRVPCWLPCAALASAESRAAASRAGACRLRGTVVGAKRPRLSPSEGAAGGGGPPPPLVGEASAKDLVAALAALGHRDARAAGGGQGGGALVDVPSLAARVVLGVPAAPGGAACLETVVEAPSARARAILTEALEGLLAVR